MPRTIEDMQDTVELVPSGENRSEAVGAPPPSSEFGEAPPQHYRLIALAGVLVAFASVIAFGKLLPQMFPGEADNIVATSVGAPRTTSLLSSAGVVWRLRNANGSINVPASVPCIVHEALLAAGVLRGDPLYRFNEVEWAWVALDDWIFEAVFNLDANDACASSEQACVLRLEGVDTVAAFTLNGAALGSTSSAFVRHELPIARNALHTGTNRLRVAIRSALSYAREQSEAYPYEVPHTQYYHVWSEPSHRNFVRKSASDFGWDWGGSYVPSGLVGGVSLREADPTRAELEGVGVRQQHLPNGSVALHVSGWLTSTGAAAAGVTLKVVVCFPECEPSSAQASPQASSARWYGEGALHDAAPAAHHRVDLSSAAGAAVVAPPIIIDHPHLWWPRGSGEAHLYELQAAICVECAKPISRSGFITRTIGLRTVELVTESAQPPAPGLPNGTSFYFRVNGVSIFAKGANVIPAHVFPTSEWDSSARWSWLLEQAAAANMNMVRVWGGGRYQPDTFYEMASRLGLMVWQEMIFACALYPRDSAFLALVEREVSEQVRRLATHPSIVIWGGNNENEAALNWYAQSRDRRDVYLTDYVKLYVDTVMPAIRNADPDRRPAVDTSPSNGLLSEGDPYVKRWGVTSTKAHASAGSWGDIHYYNYQADCEDPDTYPLARFVSEHGFQAFPAMDVYENVTGPDDWSRESRFSTFRMRHPDGNAQALAMITRHYRVPPTYASAAAAGGAAADATQRRLFDEYLWLTQLQQARCYETAFTHWRRHRSAAVNTMGILYWQLNAIWQGPDWSTIEYDGRLRLSHHATRRAFAPLLLSALHDKHAAGHWLSIHMSNDASRLVGGTLCVQLYRWRDAPAVPIAEVERTVVIDAASSHEVWRVDLAAMVQAASVTAPSLSAALSAVYVRLSFSPTATGDAASTAFHWPVPFKQVDLPMARPRVVHAEQMSPTTASIRVATNLTAAFVTLECAAVIGAFSDAGFLLSAGAAPSTVVFTAQQPFELDRFVAALRVRSLRDTYWYQTWSD